MCQGVNERHYSQSLQLKSLDRCELFAIVSMKDTIATEELKSALEQLLRVSMKDTILSRCNWSRRQERRSGVEVSMKDTILSRCNVPSNNSPPKPVSLCQ